MQLVPLALDPLPEALDQLDPLPEALDLDLEDLEAEDLSEVSKELGGC